MMKNILIVNGSRNLKSRNYLINENIKKSLKKDKYKISCIEPNKYNLHPCNGCKKCFLTGTCPLDQIDSGSLIKQNLKDADIIIFNSPVYAHAVSGDMKILIDRISYWLHLFILLGKKCLVVITTDTNGHLPVEKYLEEIVLLLGCNLIYSENFYATLSLKEMNEKIKKIVSHIELIDKMKNISFTNEQEAAFQVYKMELLLSESNTHEYSYWNAHHYFEANTLLELYQNQINERSKK